MSARGLNLLVFRDGRRQVSGPKLRLELLDQLEAASGASSPHLTSGVSPPHSKLGVLLRAGELECGVADIAGFEVALFADLTDCLASAMLGGRLPESFPNLIQAVARAPLPEWMSISAPEGFAYYNLHPAAYVRALNKLPALPGRVVVVGIRSIGTPLSAVVSAAARQRGARAARFTVRPGGHPYNRQTEFSPGEMQVIQSGVAADAGFLIVDEGPGLSGSSFLSVAEALEAAGVARERITLLCAHEPNAEALCSTNAAQRWSRFRGIAVGNESPRPAGADAFIGGGQWRSRLFQRESEWPAVWNSMERVKYLSPPERKESRLFKFAGFGHYGDCVIERERCIAAAGFAPMPRPASDGFVSYPWLDGRPMAPGDLSSPVLARLAEYCAFRSGAFAADVTDLHALQEMAEHNLSELGLDLSVALKLERPVIADGRMQPHEWLLTVDGKTLKTDCGGHGDDHFYPGPTDIAWDLAGAIVEWRMNAEQSTAFLDLYCRASGDDPRPRIVALVRAYAVFRCGYCKMAANAMQDAEEHPRLANAAAGYALQLAPNAEKAALSDTLSLLVSAL